MAAVEGMVASIPQAAVTTAALFIVAYVLSWAATAWLVGYLRRAAIIDQPNDRSSHTIPTPRGGGLAVIAVSLPAWIGLGLFYPLPPGWYAAPAGAAVLAGISWMDDRRGLPPLPRLLVQMAVVALGLAGIGGDDVFVISPLLPWWLDRVITFLGWLWFVNLYNFMDGIDGLAGAETMHIAGGVALLAFAVVAVPWVGLAGVALAAAAAGFLMLNWHPAKLFMGDVGSVPVGHLLAYLLVGLAASGQLAAALILPAYYLADATITLGRRALRGEKVWQAHRQHFYQQAVRGVGSHAAVVRTIALANLGLLVLAWLSVSWPWPCVAAAALVVGILLAQLRRMAGASR